MIRHLCLPIRPRVTNKNEAVLDVQIGIELFKSLAIELFFVVGYDSMGKSKQADN